MGSVLSAAYAALCSWVNAQLDKMEVRRLMGCYPHLRDLPAEEREAQLRWLMDEGHHPDAAARLRERDPMLQHVRFRYRHPCFRVDDDKNTKLATNQGCCCQVATS
uniref:Uncharacterized protein n=1 Tax=Arundo donax TaxID=35708 RepID=A0A0A9TRR2_ARUDO